MRDAIEVIEKAGFKVSLFQDEEPDSPKEWDSFGTLVTWHRRYCFDQDGRKTGMSGGEFRKDMDAEGTIYLPVAMIDHSGISLWVGSGPAAGDAAGWDSGQVGWIYVERAKALEMYKVKRLTAKTVEKVKTLLRAEVEQWDQYVRGDVYGYVVEGPNGEHRDSCWGFYGLDYAKQEAKEALDREIEREKREKGKIDRMMAL